LEVTVVKEEIPPVPVMEETAAQAVQAETVAMGELAV
jgi:hypothetical protein